MHMNKKIAWITDSTSSLDGNFIKQNNVFVVPLGIIFGNESFKENVDITTDEFYAKLKTAKELPKTSQPVIGEFLELYENLKKTLTALSPFIARENCPALYLAHNRQLKWRISTSLLSTQR